MNQNDARDALDDFLTLAIDSMPSADFDIPADRAQAMLDTLPIDSVLRTTMRDAFRDNIETEIDFH